MMIRKFDSKTHELWWQAEEKWFNVELEKAIETYRKNFDKESGVIAFNLDTVHTYSGHLTVVTRKNIPSKTIFVLKESV
jgi:hypothetical protein